MWVCHLDQIVQVSGYFMDVAFLPHRSIDFEIVRRGRLRRAHVLQVVQVIILARVA